MTTSSSASCWPGACPASCAESASGRRAALLSAAVLLLSFAALPLSAQPSGDAGWQMLSPGGGGQIQGVTLDPSQEGRVWLSSDVEGLYRSDDYGETWSYAGFELSHGMAFAAEPTPDGRVYQGGVWGAHYSDDAGETWTLVAPTRGKAIAAIGFGPDAQTVVLGPSWLDKDNNIRSLATKDPTEQPTGARLVYVSTDAGQTWATRTFESANGYRQVYTVSMHPTTGRIVLGASAGVYVSDDSGQSWTRVPNPAGALGGSTGGRTGPTRADGGSTGAGLSPDGQWTYAVYQMSEDSRLVFAAPTASLGAGADPWTPVSAGLPNGPDWFAPRVDPRSTTTEHRVLVGTPFTASTNRVGVQEGVFAVSAGAMGDYAWRQAVQAPAIDPSFSFEMGWENRSMISRAYGWAPASWSQPYVFVSGGQNLYRGDPESDAWPLTTWEPAYTRQVSPEPAGSWTATGFANTVVTDVCGYDAYAVQVLADHGLFQSWDSGASWTDAYKPPGNVTHTGACGIVFAGGAPYALLDARFNDYGVPDISRGTLFAALVDPRGPDTGTAPDWRAIGGDEPDGNGSTAGTMLSGLPGRQLRAVTGRGDRAYLSLRPFQGRGGVWGTENTDDLFFGDGRWRIISPPSMDSEDLDDLVLDPTDPDVLWAAGRKLWRGVRTGANLWTWEASTFDVADLSIWVYNGALWGAVVADGAQPEVVLHRALSAAGEDGSWRERTNWEATGMTPGLALSLRPASWVEPDEPYEIGGLAGHDSLVVAAVYVGNHRRGLGVFIGQAEASGVTWSDWTEGPDGPPMYHSRVAQAKVYDDGVGTYYLAATRGAGAWRRALAPAEPRTGAAAPWTESFTLPNGTTADVGVTAWTVDASALGGGATFAVEDGRFLASNTDGVGIWRAEPVAMGAERIDLSMTLQAEGALEDDDVVRVVYRIDDGPEVVLAERFGSFNDGQPDTVRVRGLQGGLLYVEVRANNSGGSERFLWDDVSIVPSTGTAAENPASAADAVALEAVFPNPTAGAATVRYRLPTAGPASVEVFDVLGRRVVLAREGLHAPGLHELPLDVSALPAGLYFVRLRAASGAAVSPLVVQ